MMDGVIVGKAIVSEAGTLGIILTSDKVVEMMTKGMEIQHLSIDPTYKK